MNYLTLLVLCILTQITMKFQLPELPYSYDALEPHIDARTMEIHYTKHHQGYTDKLNAAIEGKNVENQSIEDILRNVSQHGDAVRNNGGGYFNHRLFWEVMSPNGGGEPVGELQEAISSAFGSFSEFKEKFSSASASQFGSGWGWLIVNGGNVEIGSTPNQDNPLMDVCKLEGTPILGLDVWEHAYYLKYQNKRPDYISSWWNVVNWEEVNNRYKQAAR